MRLILAVLCLILIAACRPTEQAAAPTTATPTVPLLTGTVDILTPTEGTLIYSEMLYISGTAQGLPDNRFELALIGPDDTDIATSVVRVSADTWEIELPHTYTDVPIEVIITARSTDPAVPGDYDLVTVALAGLVYRPEGTFGSITYPVEGSTVGGEQFEVGGTVSGLSDQQVTLQLLAADGTLLDSQVIAIDHPYPLDDVPWSGEMSTDGFIGEAVLQISTSNQNTLHSVNIRIEAAAG